MLGFSGNGDYTKMRDCSLSVFLPLRYDVRVRFTQKWFSRMRLSRSGAC